MKHPYVDPEFVEWLDSQFKPLDVKPGYTKDELMFNGGQRSVVDALKNRVKKQETEDRKSFRG